MENNTYIIRLVGVIVGLFVLWGCSNGTSTRSVVASQTPVAAKPESDAAGNSIRSAVTSSPTSIKGGEICEEYLLDEISKKQADRNRLVKLPTLNSNYNMLSSDLKKWLESRDETDLAVYELSHKGKKVLVLGSTNTKATGIASNFQNWAIGLDGHIVDFLSLSDMPDLIYADENGAINYHLITYSSQFLDSKDWENLTLDLLHYRITSDGDSQLVGEERNIKCE